MTKPVCIIVLGAPRSGTTLLSTAIGSHEKICMLDEDFFLSVRRITGGKTRAVKLCVPNHIQMERKWRWWWGIVRKNGFLRKRLHYMLPRSFFSLSDYLSFFDCRIICILREPEKALSALNARGQAKRRKAIRVTNSAYDVYDALQERAPGQVAFVSFDKFLTETEDQCRKICNFVGEKYSAEMLDAPRRNRRYKGDSFDKSKIGSEDYDFEKLDDNVVSLIKRYQHLKSQIL
jgi:sulfotransferase family protein